MPNEEKLIRLLIVDDDPHKAEKVTSALRAKGIQVRSDFAEDAEDMGALLAKHGVELVIFSLDLPDFELEAAMKLIEASHPSTGLIAQTSKFDTTAVVAAMSQGARDLVDSSASEHLVRVIEREAAAMLLTSRVERLEKQYQESEKRCQNLLESSKDAVAYVHEGMYIFANQAYINLFGHSSFDDLEGTPLIDMVTSEHQSGLKAVLRDPENQADTSLDLEMLQAGGNAITVALEFAPASYDEEPCTQILIRTPADTSELEE